MKILFQDHKKGEVKIAITSLDDLWYLSQILDTGDEVSGKTERKIKLGEGTENVKMVKKQVFLAITVEKVEFHSYANTLRVSGKVKEGPEDIPRGSYHTFDVEEGTTIQIVKEQWLKYQEEKLKEAASEQGGMILIVTLDREEASYALLRPSGYTMLAEVQGEVGKKGYSALEGKDFYGDVVKHIDMYSTRYAVENIILASPAFWKEDVLKILKKKIPALVPKVVLATCNSVGKTGVEEVLKREEVRVVLKKDRTAREEAFVEELFKEIAKGSLAAYGFEAIRKAVDMRAIKILLVTDTLIHERRSAGTYSGLEAMMKSVDRAQGAVHIISTEHDAGKKLQGLGGIGAILRFRLE